MFAPARRSYAFFVVLGKVADAIRSYNGNDAFFVVLGKVAAAIRSYNGNNAFFVVLGKVAAAIRACGEERIAFGCYSLNSCSNPVMTMNRMAVMPMASIMMVLLCSGYTTSLSPGACHEDAPGCQGDVCRRQYHRLAGSHLFDQPRVCSHSHGRMNSTLRGRCGSCRVEFIRLTPGIFAPSWSNEFDPTGCVSTLRGWCGFL